MPAESRRIEEEGVLLPLAKIVAAGKFAEKTAMRLFTEAPHPARNPAQNIADLRAQIAALAAGAEAMKICAQTFGAEETLRHLKLVQENAAAAARRLVATLQEGEGTATLDDGSVIKVRAYREKQKEKKKGKAGEKGKKSKVKKVKFVLDFSGTSPRHPANFNAPPAVARAAVIYCLRALLGEDIPLNDGILRAVRIVLPPGSMLRPRAPDAVAAGNVETSQNIVNAVFAALGVCAAAQGTCNNFTVGFPGKGADSPGKQYYETICGGTGALWNPPNKSTPPPSPMGGTGGGKLFNPPSISDGGGRGGETPNKLTPPPSPMGGAGGGKTPNKLTPPPSLMGGVGGGKPQGANGADAMQTHMTNSRASDPEVLETNYPLRLLEFSFRRGSGGKGKFRGGMGATRRLLFLAEGTAAILSSHRKVPPPGIAGGGAGKTGINAVRRKNGKTEILPPCASAEMHPGDEFTIKTPGGGGAGKN